MSGATRVQNFVAIARTTAEISGGGGEFRPPPPTPPQIYHSQKSPA